MADWSIRTAVLLLTFLSSPALAWDGVSPPPVKISPSGLALGPMIGAHAIGGWPVWVEDSGLVVALDQVHSSGSAILSQEPPRCWQADSSGAVDLGPLVDPEHRTSAGGAWRVAARAGSSDLIALAFHAVPAAPFDLDSVVIHRANCRSTSEILATIQVPDGVPDPRQITSDSIALGTGVMYLIHHDLVRIDLGNPSWDVLATPDDLKTALGTQQDAAFVAAALTRDERLWVTFEIYGPEVSSGLAEVHNRTITVLHGPDSRLSSMRQMLPVDGAMLIAQPTVTLEPATRLRVLGVLPENNPIGFDTRVPPWPDSALSEQGLVGSFDGTVWMRLQAEGTGSPTIADALQPIAFSKEFSDFDRDRVSAVREAELGLFDQVYDFDGDGFNDGAELGVLGTDPKNPDSHPDLPTLPDISFGPSLLIGESELLSRHASTPGDPKFVARLPALPVPREDGSIQCALDNFANPACPPYQRGAEVQSVACVDRELQQSCMNIYAGGAQPSPDGRWGFAFDFEPGLGGGPDVRHDIVRVELATGEIARPFPMVPNIDSYDGVIYALSGDAILLTRNFREVARIDASGLTTIVTSGGDGCPVAEGLAPCVDPTPAATGSMRTVGYHRPTNSWVFSFPPSYIAVSRDRVGFVQSQYEIADGLELEVLKDIPGGGQLAKGAKNVDRSFFNGTFILPDLFSTAPGATQEHLLGEAGPWFFRGFLGKQSIYYREEAMQAGCIKKIPCEFSFAPQIIEAGYEFRTEWVPYGKALESGEIVFATQSHYNRVSGAYRNADGRYGALGQNGYLGRITRLGAVAPWLDTETFAELAGDPAILAETPLGRVDALAVGPDRICVAESGRVWEISLEAGLAASIELVDAAGMTGCAYDGSQLARLASNPAVVHVGDRSIPGLNGAAYGLLRSGDRWLIRGEGVREPGQIVVDEAYCLDDSGVAQTTGHRMIAMSEVPGGVAFIDEVGDAWVGRDPCTGPDEKLASALWFNMYLNNGWSGRAELQVSNGSLAMRPDGMFAVANRDLDVFGETKLVSLKPTYEPLEGREPMHPDFRRNGFETALLSVWAINVTAMAAVPGGEAGADWGHFEPPPAPYVDKPEVPEVPEIPEKEPDVPDPVNPQGCGCRDSVDSGGSGLLVLLLLAILARRRQRI